MIKTTTPESCIEPIVFAARLLGNDVFVDDHGQQQTVVPVPRMWLRDVLEGAPKKLPEAFLVDHDEKDVFWVMKYPAAIENGTLVSMPGGTPSKGLTFDQATAACNSLGDGWHLMTNAELAAISLRCQRTGVSNSGVGQSHDGSVSGIHGLTDGPVWVGGVRVVDGEIQVIPHNNAAVTGIDQGPESDQWRAVSAEGTFLLTGHPQALHVGFSALGIEAPLLLKGLLLNGLGDARMRVPGGEAMILRGGVGKTAESWLELVARDACRPDVHIYGCYIAL